MKRKITVTTGSRGDYGILRPVLQAISDSPKLGLMLIVTGMHLSKKFGYTINEIRNDGFKISATVDMVPKSDSNYSMSKMVGKGIIEFSKIFQKFKPDINLVLGDHDEMLASSIAAYHMNIPNAHIHGGDKSQGGVDEYNRHAITKISNIHFPATKKSRERIIKMGENPNAVFLVGSPSIDEIVQRKITNKKELEDKYKINFNRDEILLLQHPVTTQTKLSERQILKTLKAIVGLESSVIAIAPNSDAGHQKIFEYLKSYARKYPFFQLHTNIPRSDFLGMLKNCGVLVGNSSSGMIEASYFDIPVVSVGIRQKDRERGRNVFEVKGNSIKLIQNTIKKALNHNRPKRGSKDKIYGNGHAAKKIVAHLEKIMLNNNLIQKQISY